MSCLMFDDEAVAGLIPDDSFSVTASDVTIENQECKRIAGTTKVSVFCTFTAISSGQAKNVGNIPAGYRPFTTVASPVVNGYNTVIAFLTSSGDISIRCLSGSGVSSAAFTFTY